MFSSNVKNFNSSIILHLSLNDWINKYLQNLNYKNKHKCK